jgi:general secretion pathway protein I
MSDRQQREGSAGFALLEVVAALAILSLALGVLLNVVGNGLRHAGQAERMGEAAVFAQTLLAEVGTRRPVRSGSSSGEFENGYRWQLTVTEFGDATERQVWPVGAFAVSAEVLWDDGRGQRSYTLKTLRLGPRETSQ